MTNTKDTCKGSDNGCSCGAPGCLQYPLAPRRSESEERGTAAHVALEVTPARPCIIDNRTRKLRARRVNVDAMISRAIVRAAELGRPVVRAANGGGVCNSYDYRAYTDGVVAVAFPDGRAVAWCKTLPANKVTISGVLAACLGAWARPFGDERFTSQATDTARGMIVSAARAQLDAETR